LPFCCDFKADALLARATEDVRQHFAALPTYQAKWLFIATWHNVTYGGGSSTTKASRSFSNNLPYAETKGDALHGQDRALTLPVQNCNVRVSGQPELPGVLPVNLITNWE
jgi:hypothetical protein